MAVENVKCPKGQGCQHSEHWAVESCLVHADSEEAYGDIEMDQLMGRDLSSVKGAKDITVLPALGWHWCFCVPHMDGAPPFCSATSLADGTGCLKDVLYMVREGG